MPNTSVVERAPDGKYKDARFGFPEPQEVVNPPARGPDFFDLPPAAVVRLAGALGSERMEHRHRGGGGGGHGVPLVEGALMHPMEVLTTPAARAAFNPRQLSYALEDYAANGPSFDYGNVHAAAIYEFPEGLLTIMEEDCQLALCTTEDAFRAHDACADAQERS